MIQLDSLEVGGTIIATAALLISVFVFLLQWFAERVLDEAVWPLIKDWWSRRSKASALRRATAVCEHFVERMQIASDYNLLSLLLNKEAHFSSTCILAIGIFAAMMISMVIAREGFDESKIFTSAMCFGYVAYAIIVIFSTNHTFNFYVDLLQSETTYRKKTIKRLRKLLKASGMSDDEISKWTQAIKDVPSPKTHKNLDSDTTSGVNGRQA